MFSASGTVPVGAIRNASTLSSSRSCGEPQHEIDEVTALAPRPGEPEQALRADDERLRMSGLGELLARELALAVAVERIGRIVLAVSTDLRTVEDVVGAHGHELRRDLGALLSKDLHAGGVDRKRQLRVLLASRRDRGMRRSSPPRLAAPEPAEPGPRFDPSSPRARASREGHLRRAP